MRRKEYGRSRSFRCQKRHRRDLIRYFPKADCVTATLCRPCIRPNFTPKLIQPPGKPKTGIRVGSNIYQYFDMAIIYTGMNGTPDPALPVTAVLPQQPALPQAAGGVEHTWPSGDDAGQNGLPGNPGADGTEGNHSENGTDCPAVDITIQQIT